MADLVGSIFERNPLNTSSNVIKPIEISKSGFPVAQHRSKSAFSQRRKVNEAGKQDSTRLKAPPTVASTSTSPSLSSRLASSSSVSDAPPNPEEATRRQIDEENQRRVESMTEEEREEARKEIVEKFGEGIGDLLRKVREAREKKEAQVSVSPPTLKSSKSLESPEAIPLVPRHSALGHSATRPSSRADRQLRFAEVTPSDVHVYASAPPSPRRKALALPPPPSDHSDPSIVSLGSLKPPTVPHLKREDETPRADKREPAQDDAEDAGSLEDIRRRYFPSASTSNPSVEWMKPLPPSDPTEDNKIRFDLSGNIIPSSQTSSLPTHLGLHHHSDGVHAGYTLDDIFLLSRSTVPGQRVTMLAVLCHIAEKLGRGDGTIDLGGRDAEESLRRRMLAAGIEAMGERGSLGARAIDLLWYCLACWSVSGLPSDLFSPDSPTPLPIDHFFSQTADIFSQQALPYFTLLRLLSILCYLAETGPVEVCTSIMTTNHLLRYIIQIFLLSSEDQASPQPQALELLVILAQSSRSHAEKIANGPADALLRFLTNLTTDEEISHIATNPSHKTTSLSLSLTLLTSTLQLYTVLGSYGLYSHIATTASLHFIRLPRLVAVLPGPFRTELSEAWMQLMEVWIVCATNPHQTTPSHDILWSQVTAWCWGAEALEGACDALKDVDGSQVQLEQDAKSMKVCATAWNAAAAWLEGCRINGVKGGEKERLEAIEMLQPSFEKGEVYLRKVIAHIKQTTLSPVTAEGRESLRHPLDVLSGALRLWLASLSSQDTPPASPPFNLPYAEISDLCAQLVKSDHLFSPPFSSCTRSASYLLSTYLRFSRCLPGISFDLWIAQALSVLLRLVPGDEAQGVSIVETLCRLLTPELLREKGFIPPKMLECKATMDVIKPFLVHSIRSRQNAFIGPLHPSPWSIQTTTTQRISSSSKYTSLPLHQDWLFSPIDHLLRSGTSPVFQALPSAWDFTEVDIVRMSLVFAKLGREVLGAYGLCGSMMSREQVVFGCMKVFMLEQDQHESGQGREDKSEVNAEVYRDEGVESLMESLLSPLRCPHPGSTPSQPSQDPSSSFTLEEISAPFLGPSTPFYQFHTDFVALYDSISFSHPLFGQLLFPPTSMRYPVDYRKYLWHDYAHLLPNLNIPLDKVLGSDLREWMYPVERSGEMIGAYVKSLQGGRMEGFLAFVALHHVAGCVWGDFGVMGDGESAESVNGGRGSDAALRALLTMGNDAVLRDVVRYWQPEDLLRVPLDCFEGLPVDLRDAREQKLRAIGGEKLLERLGLVG